MKVKELIGRLLEINQELPVCVGDWQEAYMMSSEKEAEIIKQIDGWHLDREGKIVSEPFLQIGEGRNQADLRAEFGSL